MSAEEHTGDDEARRAWVAAKLQLYDAMVRDLDQSP